MGGLFGRIRETETERSVEWGERGGRQSVAKPIFKSRPGPSERTVRAMNSPDEWGSSDHCRILIEIEDD